MQLTSKFSSAALNLDFYTEVKDLDYLVPLLEQDRRTRKFSQLNRVICEIIEDFGLVSFETLCVEVSPPFFHLPSSLACLAEPSR